MKKLIRKLLNRFGYEIVKTDNWYASKSNKERVILVGGYPITMPGNNTLLNTYAAFPDFNSILGRLAKAMYAKYPNMTIVDIGANVGDTIAIFNSQVKAPIIGIEGDTTTFSFLRKNVVQFNNVSIVNTFLGDKKEELQVDLEKGGWNTTIIPSATGQKKLELTTLDDVLSKDTFSGNIIKVLKLDIEGFDTIVLRGSYNTIKKDKPVLFFEYNRDNMEAIQEDGLSTIFSFTDHGYNKIAFFDHRSRLLLVTSLRNRSEITNLHNYVVGPNNILGHIDICIFHSQDDDVAAQFIIDEEKYCGYPSR